MNERSSKINGNDSDNTQNLYTRQLIPSTWMPITFSTDITRMTAILYVPIVLKSFVKFTHCVVVTK